VGEGECEGGWERDWGVRRLTEGTLRVASCELGLVTITFFRNDAVVIIVGARQRVMMCEIDVCSER
jgi:hypothetical protein